MLLKQQNTDQKLRDWTIAALTVLIGCSASSLLPASAQGGSEPMRNIYGQNPADLSMTPVPPSQPNSQTTGSGFSFSKLGSHAGNLFNNLGQRTGVLNPPGYGQNGYSYAPSGNGYGNGGYPQNGYNYGAPPNNVPPPGIASGHSGAAMPNPAYAPVQRNDESAEHQRILDNMRKAGYSPERINAMDPYTHSTYSGNKHIVNGITVWDDNMTAGQAFENVKNFSMNNMDYTKARHAQYDAYKRNGGTASFTEFDGGGG